MDTFTPFRYAAASVVVAVAGAAFAATAPITDMPAGSGAANPASPATHAFAHGADKRDADEGPLAPR